MHRVVKLSNYCVITKNNVIMLDIELDTRNSFTESEAQELCDKLNKDKSNVVV